ncbi:MAG: DNA primase [Dehalococcoidia bacterium]|jgi:DNA primase
MSAIEEVKQKTDIVEIIGQYTALKKSGRNLTGLCPFHSEKHPSFFVYPEQQSWHCFGACNTGGDVLSFIMKKENMEFGDALRFLADRAGVVLPTYSARAEDKEEKEELYRINEAAAVYFDNLLLKSPGAENARAYVTKRGFTDQTVSAFQIGFSLDSWEALKQYLAEKGFGEEVMITAGLVIKSEDGKTHDRFRGKLMFPIHDSRGRTIGFGARVLDDSLPKYVNSPQTPTFDKSSVLYGIDRAASDIRKKEMAIVMEGYMDVITAHQNGITNTVASMGTAVTETQVNTLKKLSKNLVLALDADAAGEEAMLRTIAYENILNSEIRVVVMPEGKDPDDIIKEDVNNWQDLIDTAIPLMDFLFDRTTAPLDLSTARDKSAAVNKLGPIINSMSDTVRQAHYIQKLADTARVDVQTINQTLARLKPASARRKAPATKTAIPATTHLQLASPLEEYCLTLLLQYPELKTMEETLLPEYFEHSENREIFRAWQANNDETDIKESLDPTLYEQYDKIIGRELLSTNNIEQRYVKSILDLEEKYLRNTLARGTDSGKSDEELINISNRLKEIQSRKKLKPKEARR